MFELAARLIAYFYGLVPDYSFALAMVAVVVMLLITPLTLKSTKGMLEMQKLQPEMKRMQQQFKGDRQKMNEAMMKLYQEHKVNPLASCLPLLAQMPVFIIMFNAIRGLTIRGDNGLFTPKYLDANTDIYSSLVGQSEMLSLGVDLAKTPLRAMQDNFVSGLVYALLILLLAGLYWVQQRMVASRTVSPTMSAGQAKLLQYMPVAFAVFQIWLPTGLVVYYMTQAVIRIVQQQYITQRFYKKDDSLGRQAQAASLAAREMKDLPKPEKKEKKNSEKPVDSKFVSKRVTPPKNSSVPSVSRRPKPPGQNRSKFVQKKKKPTD
ncbi:MAG: YidC/Oxa1 family membrane protein insertase [Actinobacteria bacterium]|nr:YidC/Oxa1 family membrane protein insertase [Actinomycetota bacterium]